MTLGGTISGVGGDLRVKLTWWQYHKGPLEDIRGNYFDGG